MSFFFSFAYGFFLNLNDIPLFWPAYARTNFWIVLFPLLNHFIFDTLFVVWTQLSSCILFWFGEQHGR